MYDAVNCKNDFAIKKLIKKFGLTELFMKSLDIRALENFFNSILEVDQFSTITIDYEFVRPTDDSYKNSMRSLYSISKHSAMANLVQHPAITSFVDYQFERFTNFHVFNFVALLVMLFLSGLFRHPLILCVYLCLREVLQTIFEWKSGDNKCALKNFVTALLIVGIFVSYYYIKHRSAHYCIVIALATFCLIQCLIITSELKPSFAYTVQFLLFKVFTKTVKICSMTVPILMSVVGSYLLAVKGWKIKFTEIRGLKPPLMFTILVLLFVVFKIVITLIAANIEVSLKAF